MLNGGKFTNYLQSGLWAEVANTATFLENHLTTPNRSVNPFQQFFGKGKSNVLMSMQKFGEMGITTFSDNTHQARLGNQGTLGIGLIMPITILLIHTRSSTQKPSAIF